MREKMFCLLVSMLLVTSVAIPITIAATENTFREEESYNEVEKTEVFNYDSKIQALTSNEINGLLLSSSNVVLIDIRSERAFHKNHIEGAVSLPMAYFSCDACLLKKALFKYDDTIILYGTEDEETKHVCSILKEKGYTQVYYLKGGINSWTAAEYQTTESSQIPLPEEYEFSTFSDISEVKPSCLVFYNTDCHFCQRQLPLIDEMQEIYKEQIEFVKINVKERRDLADELDIDVLPTVILVLPLEKERVASQRLVGFTEKKILVRVIDAVIDEFEKNKEQYLKQVETERETPVDETKEYILSLTVEEVRELQKEYPDVLFVDIRAEDLYKSNHIEQAVSLPYSLFSCESCFVNKLSVAKDHPIIIYSDNDDESQKACTVLVEFGFTSVYHMLGGITLWQGAEPETHATIRPDITEQEVPHPGTESSSPFTSKKSMWQKSLEQIPESSGFSDDCGCTNTYPENTESVSLSEHEQEIVQEIELAKKAGNLMSAKSLEEELVLLRNQPMKYSQPPSPGNAKISPISTDEYSEPQDVGSLWLEEDIMVAGTNLTEIKPSIISDSSGTLYTALEIGGSTYEEIRIYRSDDNGQTWYYWYWIWGAGDIVNPSIGIGEGLENWLFISYVQAGTYIQVARIDLDNVSYSEIITVSYNSLGVSNPRIVTDGPEYSGWYPYLIWNSKAVDNWIIRFSRSFDYGETWENPTNIVGYCGYPDEFYDATNAHPDIDFGSGVLYVAYDNFLPGCYDPYKDIYVLTSVNYGYTWSSVVRLTTSNDQEFDASLGAVKNYTSAPTAVITYTRYWASSDYDVWYVYTQDGGATWSSGSCIKCSYDNEHSSDVATSLSQGALHVAFWDEYYIDYAYASYLSPNSWTLRYDINNFEYASSVYPRPSVVVNPTQPVSEEAGIAWTDFRNSGMSYDIYYDGTGIVGMCFDYDIDEWINPPAVGDWNIDHEIECNDGFILLNGDLNINAGGELRINNIWLAMNVDIMGEYGINIFSGGTFKINSKDGYASYITNGYNSSAFPTFKVHSGASFAMRNSVAYNIGYAWNEPNYDEAGIWVNADNSIFENNWIGYNHYVGIFLYKSDGHYIYNNTLYENYWDGIKVLNSDNTGIYNNHVYYTQSDSGIEISNCPGIYVYDNEVYSSGDDGIAIGNSQGAFVWYNYVEDNHDDGIDISSSPNSYIEFNEAINNHNDGIVISACPNIDYLDYNDAIGNGNDGIVVSSSPNIRYCELNEALDNGNDGIVLSYCDNSTVWYNDADDNGDTGIVISHSDGVYTYSNVVTNNWRGIYVAHSIENNVEWNIVGPHVWYGIHLFYTTDSALGNNSVDASEGEWDSCGIYLSNSPRNTLSENSVTNNKNGVVLWHSKQAVIDNNIVSNAITSNVYGISLQYSNDSQVFENELYNNGYGVHLTHSHSVIIRDNTATGNSVGISLHAATDADIHHNYVCNNGAGISLSGSSLNTIYLNDVNDNTNGITLAWSSNSNTINNNDVLNNNFGISLKWSSNSNIVQNNIVTDSIDYGAYLFRVDWNSITENDFQDADKTGMYLETSHHNTITDNNFRFAGDYGINLFDSDENTISINNVRESGDIGIELSSSNENSIEDNNAKYCGIGISIRFSYNNDIINNEPDHSDMGIALLRSDWNTLTGNLVSYNNNNGIDLSLSDNNDIYNNDASNNPNYGIHLYGSEDNRLSNNIVEQNGLGIYLDWSSNNQLDSNTVRYNNLTGIALYWSSNNNEVDSNVVKENGNVSIRISSSHENLITNNEVMYNNIGIYLDWSTQNTISGNNANDNNFHGISLDWLSNNNQISYNDAERCIIGISVEWSSENTIAANSVNFNNVSILLEWFSSNNGITNNDACFSNSYGIALFWSSNNNVITDNLANNNNIGMYFDEKSTANSLYYNTVCNNTEYDIQDEDSNYGDENTCSLVYNWDDDGTTGCTYHCYNEPPLFFNEQPPDGSIDVSISLSELSVTIEDYDGDSFDWTIQTSPDIGSSSGAGEYNGIKTCAISGLNYDVTYTWYVNATDTGSGLTRRASYTFTTESTTTNNPPYEPSNPDPDNHETGVDINADLSWTGGDPDPGDTVTYDIYFGTTSPPPQVVWGQSANWYDPGTMNYNTKYYWKITAWDNHGASTPGSTWDFTTEQPPTPVPNLDCTGYLIWTDVEPGSTVTGTFSVSNVGDPGSLLDWEILSFPTWGTWTFTPSSGMGLTPEDSPVTVNVEVVVPNEQNEDFTGEVKIVNSDDSTDYCIIPISLATPESNEQTSSPSFQQQQMASVNRCLQRVFSLV
jgi:parallel beta-helix repeat protein